jgi:acyl carrier protein
MDAEKVSEKVTEILIEQLYVGKEEITLDSELRNDLGADDVDVVEMIMALEEEYDIVIPDIEIDKFQTVRDVVTYIQVNT